jgi:hypothetical protein
MLEPSNITGPLEPGVAQIINPASKDTIGYVFTENNPAGQLQRWLLHGDPNNSLAVAPPPASMANFTLDEWRAYVTENWQPNYIYVRAQANVYQYGQTYGGVVWTQIPHAAELPMPSYPPGDAFFQLDFTYQGLELNQETWSGRVFASGRVDEPSSAEYWSLPTGFVPAGANAPLRVSVGTETVGDLEQFVTLANQSFTDGSHFVITGCLNYQGAAPPAHV